MPRGSKTCPSCKTVTGPRAWNCPSCGHGFTLRGKKKPDRDVTPEAARLTPAEEAKQRLWNLIEPYEGDDDLEYRERYETEGQTYQSKCGTYRIREQFTFMGVNMREHFSKCIYLLRRERHGWIVMRPKGHFKTILAALRRMATDMNGNEPKPTNNKEKLAKRVKERMKKKKKKKKGEKRA